MRLLVCISHHGLGHLAQTAAVLDALRAARPDIRLVVRSALAEAVLRGRIAAPFEYHPSPMDCGFVMRDAVRLDLPASLAAYRALHAGWHASVGREADWLRAQRIDRVFSNVAYLPLAAAQHAGLPAAAMCSLNWADLFAHYFHAAPGGEGLHAQILDAYRMAGLFIRPEPAMPMPDLPAAVGVPPVAQRAQNRRDALLARLGLAPETRLVLLGMGGIDYRCTAAALPARDGMAWLVPDAWGWRGDGVYLFSETGLPFGELLASCDALVGKPGYGSFVEAAAHGVPVAYLPRADWPETRWLTAWLHAHARAARIEEEVLQAGGLPAVLQQIWRQAPVPPVRADGAGTAAHRLLELYA